MPKNHKHITQQMHIWATYMLFFNLPMPDKFLPLSIVLWASTWFVYYISNFKEKHYTLNKYILIGQVLFAIWTLFGFASVFIFSTDASSLIERRMMFILLPIILLFGESSKITRENLIKALFYGAIVAVVIYTIPVVFKYQSLNLETSFFRSYLENYKHSAYLSLILIVAFYLRISYQNSFSRKEILSYILVYSLFGLYIFVLRSRAGMINFILLSGLVLGQFIRVKVGILKTIIVSIPILVLLFFAVISNEKFQELIIGSENVNGRVMNREVLWKSSVDLIKEKPVFGYGLGGAESLLVKQSYINGLDEAEELNQNCHNQYLQSSLDNGLLGTIFLILAFVLHVLGNSKDLKIVLSVFCFLITSFMFESMLERIAGIALLSSLIYLFSISDLKKSLLSKSVLLNKNILFISIIPLLILIISQITVFIDRGEEFDSKNPKTYAYGRYKILKELPGVLPVDLKAEVKGLKLDDSAFPHPYLPHYSITTLFTTLPNECDSIHMSVYCYASPDFSGDQIFIAASGKDFGKRDYYNLEKKGEWQYLNFSVYCPSVKGTYSLYFALKEGDKIKEMDGCVIFALPKYTIYKNGKEMNKKKING